MAKDVVEHAQLALDIEDAQAFQIDIAQLQLAHDLLPVKNLPLGKGRCRQIGFRARKSPSE